MGRACCDRHARLAFNELRSNDSGWSTRWTTPDWTRTRWSTPRTFDTSSSHLASGVAVVTTSSRGREYGMTASWVTSLSVDPPLMLACINNVVPTALAIAESGNYVVNVLDHDQGDLAHQFTRAQRRQVPRG